MIIVCEPQCKGFSHEKVNSAFLYAIRLAFPKERIRFYAHKSHIQALGNILRHDGVQIENIDFLEISFDERPSVLSYLGYKRLFRSLFHSELSKGHASKFIFLSFSGMMLEIIQGLVQHEGIDAKIALVLHGEFEHIDENRTERLPLLPSEMHHPGMLARIKKMRLADVPQKAISFARAKIDSFYSKHHRIPFARKFKLKDVLARKPSNQLHFIALSPHILENAGKYLELIRFNFSTVMLPTIFAKPIPETRHEHVKFAVFGYGYSAMLQRVLAALETKDLKNSYEIRIIGMDGSGTEGFRNVVRTSHGKALTRDAMEKELPDIDMFLILYDKSLYRLSCSASIFEALSYMKPILHFENDCIDFFNQEDKPIGIRAHDIEDYAQKMADIINNYRGIRSQLDGFQDNINELRSTYSIQNASTAINRIFLKNPAISDVLTHA